jgi:cob(I)alamin adenosyltransferase
VSIITKTGDKGTTGLMYNRRVAKSHPRVEAYGTVDELNAALGMCRVSARQAWLADQILSIQKQLVIVMGELATQVEDLSRYVQDGYSVTTAEMTSALDALGSHLEGQKISFRGWATPGANPSAATLDVARTVCRRAERAVCHLHEQGQLANAEVIIFLNRLSDCLWLLARWAETQSPE